MSPVEARPGPGNADAPSKGAIAGTPPKAEGAGAPPHLQLPGWQRALPWIFGAVLFGFYVATDLVQKQLVHHDATLWISYGLQIFRGGLDRFDFMAGAPPISPLVYPPGYPFLIGLVSLPVRDPVWAAQLVSACCGALLAVVIYHFVLELLGNVHVARVAAAGCGLYPPLFSYATTTFVTCTGCFFLVLALYLAVRAARSGTWKMAMTAGAAMGLAVLVRFEYGLYVLVGLGSLWFGWRAAGPRLKAAALYLAAIVGVYAMYAVPLYLCSGYVLVSPYVGNYFIYNASLPPKPRANVESYREMRKSMVGQLYNRNTAMSLNLTLQNKVRVEEPARREPAPREGRAHPQPDDRTRPGEPARQQPAPGARKEKPLRGSFEPLLGRLRLYSGVASRTVPELWLWPGALFLIGAAYLCFVRPRYAAGVLGAVFLLTLAVYPLCGGGTKPRYYFHLVPFILVVSATGLFAVARVCRARSTAVLYCLAACLCGFLVYRDVSRVPTSYGKGPAVWLTCAKYLREHAPARSVVMCRKNWPAFYSNMRTEWLPDEPDLGDVQEYAAFIEADYLIIDRDFTCELMPQYEALLADPVPPGLVLCHEFNQGTPRHTRIFKFVGKDPPGPPRNGGT